jgi:fatty-acyl-CoA synthase
MDLSGWIEGWAGQAPDKVAVHFEGADVTYAQMAARVRRLAAALKHGLGVGRGDRVAYLGLNRPEMLDLVFACARLGAMLAPLNWRLAAPEHLYILRDCGARALLAEPDFVGQCEALRAALPDMKTVAYDSAAAGWLAYDALLAEAQGDDANPHVDHACPLLLVYTSGTTGHPKGAVLTQDALFWNAVNAAHAHDLTSADHVLTTLPMFHVGGLNIQTLPALHAGATVTLHRRFDPALSLRDIAARRPTITLMVPATMSATIRHPDFAATDISSLRLVMAGSSTIPEALIRAFHDRFVPVGQVYGSTETAPVAIYLRGSDARARVGSAGRPAVHCGIRIVDEAGNDLPAGKPGEILVKGPNLFLEYWGDPAATAAALDGGWFRSGDIGHRDADGFIWIDDRKKDVVISGGENIYPAELEGVLADCPDIVEAAVVARPDERWGEVAVAVVVGKPGCGLDVADVLALFDGRLARFKHPRDVVFVDALPRNVMGKVLKYELRERLRG